jgi:hypothetical protein
MKLMDEKKYTFCFGLVSVVDLMTPFAFGVSVKK